jgi:uncharacterized protein RhaS with RHS repeats
MPSIGRFINKDPIDSLNPYAYSENNPISFIDPSGNIAIADDLAIIYLVGVTGYIMTTTDWLAVG